MKKNLRKLAALLLTGTMVLGTGTTTLAKEAPAPAAEISDEQVVIAISAEPNSLVPDVAFLSNYISAITSLIYEPLIDTEYSTVELYDTGLVTAWEDIDDTHFQLTLREGVKFQNGEEFTSEDVYYQFEQGTQGAQTDHYGLFDMSGFEIIDDYNIIICTKYPWAQAKELLGFSTFMAVSKTELEKAGGAGVTAQYLENAGTGKYRFKEWVPGEYILLERNEDYWNQDDLGYFKEVKFVFITDAAARAMAVQSGDADIALDCQVSDYELYNGLDGVKAEISQSGTVQTLFLNDNGGPCSNELVREAIYNLIDKEAIREVANSGFGDICDTVISINGPMSDGICESAGKGTDVEKAKALLEEAGYTADADGMYLTLKMRGQQTNALMSMIQEELRLGGINVELELAETPVHFAALAEGDYDMYTSSQQFGYYSETVRCCDGIAYDWSDVMGGCGYKSDEMHEIATRCLQTFDIEERKAAYAEFQQYFRDHYVSVALYTGVLLSVADEDIEGIGLYSVGCYYLADMYSTAR